MPRVDAHVHLGDSGDARRFQGAMTRAGIALGINLSPSREMIAGTANAGRRTKTRILHAPGTYRIDKGLRWSRKDLESFKAAGCVGTKILCKYQSGLNRKAIVSKVKAQEQLGGLPLWVHVVDPPRPGFWQPGFWDRIHDAEKLIRDHPSLPVIMAHGFWLMIDDKGLDVLAGFFDRYSNLNVDLSAVFQWWDPPQPSYDRLRDFMITYADRILYGTDATASHAKKRYYENTHRILETRGRRLNGFFPADSQTYIRGFGLPKETLNRIYWWNAARLIPRVAEALSELGWGASKERFHSLPAGLDMTITTGLTN